MGGLAETGFEVDAEILKQLQEFGAPPEAIDAAARGTKEVEAFELFEDNEQSVTIFRSVATQWRVGGMAGTITGLDYSVLPGVMRIFGVKPSERKQVFEDVRIMEMEALKVFSEKAAKK